jgi:hypothetical protein
MSALTAAAIAGETAVAPTENAGANEIKWIATSSDPATNANSPPRIPLDSSVVNATTTSTSWPEWNSALTAACDISGVDKETPRATLAYAAKTNASPVFNNIAILETIACSILFLQSPKSTRRHASANEDLRFSRLKTPDCHEIELRPCPVPSSSPPRSSVTDLCHALLFHDSQSMHLVPTSLSHSGVRDDHLRTPSDERHRCLFEPIHPIPMRQLKCREYRLRMHIFPPRLGCPELWIPTPREPLEESHYLQSAWNQLVASADGTAPSKSVHERLSYLERHESRGIVNRQNLTALSGMQSMLIPQVRQGSARHLKRALQALMSNASVPTLSRVGVEW